MAKLAILQGATSVTTNIFIADSSSTTGAGLTGLVFNTSNLVCYYMRPKVAATSVTLATLAAVTSAYSSGGFKEIDSTNAPGWYRFDVPDAAIANAERFVSIHFKGATNMAPLPLEIELTGWDNQNGVRGGLTALPNAAAEAAGGLYTRGSGAGQIAQSTNGQIDVDAKKINSVSTSSVTTINANQGTTQPLNFTGTAGSALVKSDMVDIAGAAVSTSSAQIGVNAVQINAVSTASVTTVNANVGTTQPVNFTGTGASALAKSDMVDIAGAAVSTSTAQLGVNVVNFGGSAGTFASGRPEVNTTHIKGTSSAGTAGYVGLDWSAINAPTTAVALTGTTISTSQVVASVSGAVGSVTGAVGSVTGNVGGNVTGSVGSVVGNVGGNVAGSVASVTAITASGGIVSADVKKINAVTVNGAGVSGNEWGP